MDQQKTPPKTKIVFPHQLAWLHRSELDRNGVQVWEKPDGGLYLHRGQEKLTIEIPDKS